MKFKKRISEKCVNIYLKTKFFEDNKNTVVNINFFDKVISLDCILYNIHYTYYYKLYQILHKNRHFETLNKIVDNWVPILQNR